ncbi:helix-turn-helix transcriptional regulator, partial [Vibrio anguillarum]|uniref:helix-turn-helix transcriptional regulator n=1 Tax=Vibrio anguillarum TaxID=55601 RepID=UPI001F2C5938
PILFQKEFQSSFKIVKCLCFFKIRVRSDKLKVIRLKEIIELTGLSKSTIYRLTESKKFPKQLSLGERSVGWLESEVNEWLEKRIDDRNHQKLIA